MFRVALSIARQLDLLIGELGPQRSRGGKTELFRNEYTSSPVLGRASDANGCVGSKSSVTAD